ncbi:hypothetical protein [Lacipirellula sp.]|uniref:hypothetical protein n=1 Tax=Lacipirellula sp. TaxID=2691419 RepID=UPI003D0AD55B
MAKDMMVRCEEKRLHKIDGKKEMRWVQLGVADLSPDASREIRCLYCHGQVKLRTQKESSGPQILIEHKSRQDAERCQGSAQYQGSHQRSEKPVV